MLALIIRLFRHNDGTPAFQDAVKALQAHTTEVNNLTEVLAKGPLT